ncbi:MAG: hypothetical protein A2W80_16210 [Candidatus Riflebacteria bacterium GWC2_50_8]|nr:MAG: hypothetical protein A2W80_16210 [Candidatus Riflebacteria bacterium GWC2_50_8]
MKNAQLSPQGHLQKNGISFVELVIVISIITLVFFSLYRFFQVYVLLHQKTDDKLENVSEAWQVLRVLNEDFFQADFPDGNPERWREILQVESAERITIFRRNGDTVAPVNYLIDSERGNLSREYCGKRTSLVQGRFKNLNIEMNAKSQGQNLFPRTIYFRVRIELENPRIQKAVKNGSFVPLKDFNVDINVFPAFLNQSLSRRYFHKGIP